MIAKSSPILGEDQYGSPQLPSPDEFDQSTFYRYWRLIERRAGESELIEEPGFLERIRDSLRDQQQI